jgi:hypothetical protein
VLDRRHHQPFGGRPRAAPQTRRQRQRIGLRAAGREDDVARQGADRVRNRAARLFDQPAGLAALGMNR